MLRRQIPPRPDWQSRVEQAGLIYHSVDGRPYWDESVYYQFSMPQILEIEKATNELSRMCLDAVQHVLDHNRLGELRIPERAHPLIRAAWEQEPPSIYGRFDLSYNGQDPPKLLEFNADTPTALLESAVIQWYWQQDADPNADQFNSIHERLIAKWTELKEYIEGVNLYFAHADDVEDIMTVTYLRDTAEQAGLKTSALLMEELGWDRARGKFVDLQGQPIVSIFKLYPWEWLIHEEFAAHFFESYESTQWIEPIWKMVLSNKGILPILWELYPGHPNLLEAHLDDPHSLKEYARKPLLSREGANISIHQAGGDVQTDGEYGEEGYIFQQLAPPAVFDGKWPVLGSWLIDWEAAGMGIRESDGPITDNLSRFVPHLII